MPWADPTAGIVTPEAVELSFETAGLGSRMVATVIDLVCQAVALTALLFGLGALGGTSIGLAGVLFAIFGVLFVAPVVIETAWRGKSVGRAVLGMRVVTVEGAPVRLRHALVRTAFSLLDLWMTEGAVAVLCVLLTRRNQRLGDLAAGTLVVRERTAATPLAAVTFAVPPGWEAYASTIDVSGISSADYQVIRSFLLRAALLPNATRDQVGREIAMPLLHRLNHRPPPGVPAEALLACIAANYQQRQRRVGAAAAAVSAWAYASPSEVVVGRPIAATPTTTGFAPPS